MPKIADLAALVINLVAEELEVPKEQILSKCRNAEVVDARHLAIRLLYSKDLYPSRIAEIFGLSSRNIHYIITNFEDRLQTNKMLRNNYERIEKEL